MSAQKKAARVAALLIFAICGLLAQAAFAETLWIHPDRDPFQGTLADALELFAARGIPRQVLEEQRRLYAAGHCTRRRIGDGEHIALMTFGSNRVLPDVIAEASLWPDWAPRGVIVCSTAAQGGAYALVRPDVCGNWSEERLPPSAGPAPAAVEVPDAGPGPGPEAAGVPGMPGIAGGAGGFLSPAGFTVPAGFPGIFGGDLPSPAEFVVPMVSPDLPDEEFPSLQQPGPTLPDPLPPTPPDSPPPKVPEPASGLLLGSALAVLVLVRRVCGDAQLAR